MNDDSHDVQINIPYKFKNLQNKDEIVSPFEYDKQFAKGKVVDLEGYNIDPHKKKLNGPYVVMDAKFDVCGVVVTLRPVTI